MNGEVLNSWKEIASYLGRGVRTVQRWEQELGLPVRRPRGKERSAVLALKPDLDRWLKNTPHGVMVIAAGGDSQRHAKLHVNTEQLRKRTHEIIERSTHMQEVVKTTLALTSRLREQQARSMRTRGIGAYNQKLLVTPAVELTSKLATQRGEPPDEMIGRKPGLTG